MKQFMTVLKFELNNYFKNKSFLVTTLFLAVLLVGVIVVPTFFLPGLTGVIFILPSNYKPKHRAWGE